MGELATFSIDHDVLQEWKDNNKGKNMSQIIQKHMESMNEEDKKREEEKKVMPSRNGALLFNPTKVKFFSDKDEKQVTLDLYKMENNEILDHIKEIKDKRELGELNKKSHLILSLTKTSLHRMRNQ